MQQLLREKFRDRTVIAVAHRLETIMDFDKVIVMDAGRIVETGPPRELAKKNRGRFNALVNTMG